MMVPSVPAGVFTLSPVRNRGLSTPSILAMSVSTRCWNRFQTWSRNCRFVASFATGKSKTVFLLPNRKRASTMRWVFGSNPFGSSNATRMSARRNVLLIPETGSNTQRWTLSPQISTISKFEISRSEALAISSATAAPTSSHCVSTVNMFGVVPAAAGVGAFVNAANLYTRTCTPALTLGAGGSGHGTATNGSNFLHDLPSQEALGHVK
mmetsp:Transcript_29214/g.43310  ORF Transcript_29214/g.43310 Transcript_29214/m.43310 type:complete len:209 (-) Transcript_29214:366-992(-)